MKRIFLCVIFFLTLLSFAGAEEDLFQKQGQALDIGRLENAAPQDSESAEITEDLSFEEGLKTLLSRFGNEFRSVFRRSLSCIGVILAISVLAAVMNNFCDAGSDKIPRYIGVVSALAVTAAASGSISSLIGMGVQAIESMNTFSKALLPTLTAAVAASGSPLGATARYSATVLFSDIALTIISTVLIPLTYTYIAAATANAAIPGASIGKIADFLQWIVSGALKIILMIFVTYITVTGLVASTTDVAGAKTARVAISGAVPIVGGILSEAAETVLAGAKIMKNAIGIFGMLTILSICLTPFLVLAVNYFTFKAAAAITTPLCEARIGELVDRIGGSFGVVLGMTAACAFLLFMSILSCMFAVGAA